MFTPRALITRVHMERHHVCPITCIMETVLMRFLLGKSHGAWDAYRLGDYMLGLRAEQVYCVDDVIQGFCLSWIIDKVNPQCFSASVTCSSCALKYLECYYNIIIWHCDMLTWGIVMSLDYIVPGVWIYLSRGQEESNLWTNMFWLVCLFCFHYFFVCH